MALSDGAAFGSPGQGFVRLNFATSRQILREALERMALVIRGAASDVLDPDTAERMVEEALPNARLAVVARAGHSVMTDNPEGFSEAVSKFALGDA